MTITVWVQTQMVGDLYRFLNHETNSFKGDYLRHINSNLYDHLYVQVNLSYKEYVMLINN